MALHQQQTKIAVIGMGLIGPRHAQVVLDNPNAILTAIVDPLPQSAAVARRFGVMHYASVADLLKSHDKPYGAIVCTPNHMHVPISLQLIAAGIDVLVEKPISTDIASGQKLVDAAQVAGVKLLVGHHRRFNPYVIATQETLTSGSLGDIIAINGLWTTFKPPNYFHAPTEWRQTSTGGVLLINMIHEIDILHDLLGPISRVYAEKTLSKRGFDAEEGAAITLRFASGVVGTFLISDHTPSPHNFEAGTGENPLIPQVGEDFLRIFGTKGMVSVPDLARWSYDGQEQKSWHSALTRTQGEVQAAVPFQRQLQHFVDVVEGRERAKCSGEMGLAALVVCEALKRSMRDGIPVSIGAVETRSLKL